jgi:hypothetical protein
MSLGRTFFLVASLLPAGAAVDWKQVRTLESQGAIAEARQLLADAVRGPGATWQDALGYAEFLDRRRDAGAIAAYEAALGKAPADQRERIEKRLRILRAKNQPSREENKDYAASITIPGPLRSFSRMAALSPDLTPNDLLAALARIIVTNGYQASSGNESLEQTEYLKLVFRYLSQAKELEKLASNGVIRIEQCESSQTGDLLKVLGYRMRGSCGSDVVLETVNASRAFLTIDSGFPLAELEQALRTNRTFEYDFQPTRVPVLYGAEYWQSARERGSPDTSFIEFFLSDPLLCRLYLGLSKLDPVTAAEMKEKIPVLRLKAFAHVLDFYGGMFEVDENKRAVVPGGARAAPGWAKLVGVDPEQGAAFFGALIAKHDGWLASYFDATARISGPVQAYLTDPLRMERFYTAIRGRVTSPGPARPVFRANTDMMLLTTGLRLNASGQPHIPGGLEVWKTLFMTNPNGKYDGKLTKSSAGWKEPDDLVEALFALCRKSVENEPLKIYLSLSNVDRRRAMPLDAVTVARLMRDYRTYQAQYTIFAEVPSLSDRTILQFLDLAQSISQIRDQQLRSEAAGIMQGLVGLWQIFCRQELIPASRADSSLTEILAALGKARNNPELFDAGRAGVATLLAAAGTPAGVRPQDRMLDLLAGESRVTDAETHTLMIQEMMRIFEAQRLVSLDDIFDLDDNLEALSKGEKLNTQLVNRLAARIQEIQPARISLSGAEKNAMAFGYYTERHIDNQRKVNFRAIVERNASDPARLKEARGLLTPFLRDTLVGFNYIHYAPPGAQVLYTNPLFVRSHDFIGVQGTNQTWRQTEVFGTGWPSSAGGRLVGSLSHLPYALAEAEQNFLIPTREQALIWGDLAPQMILSAKVPRWWRVTPAQMHFAALHLRLGESAIAEAALDPSKRPLIVSAVSKLAAPVRARRLQSLLEAGDARGAIDATTPAELFVLGMQLIDSNADVTGPEAAEIRRLAAESPATVNRAAIAAAFGTPKPTLANSYRPDLLNLRTFPTLMGYSSRILAESWESSLLYFAALADEAGIAPSQLNVRIPEWTRRTVESIFATHLEDWPALLRSLRTVGAEVRAQARPAAASPQQAALQ